jgi:hypothetical protein
MTQELETRRAMLSLLNALSGSILALEALADEATRTASEITNYIGAEELRELARNHRVRALELQGKYAALSTEYTARYHSEP